MFKEETRVYLRTLILDYLKDKAVELVDVVLRFEGEKLFLRILVDRPEGGIILDECGALNRGIGMLLEEKDAVPGAYVLEVSSPGLDRPLKTRSDFARCINRPVRLFFLEPIGGRTETQGVVQSVDEEAVYVQQDNDNVERIDLALIRVGKQIIEP